MSDKPGLNEDEYIALVERVQQAMCIEPFHPDVTDVVVLIGTCRMLNTEIEGLRTRNKTLEARLDQILILANLES